MVYIDTFNPPAKTSCEIAPALSMASKVDIVSKKHTVDIAVRNSKPIKNGKSDNGIGLQNLKNQLNLLYQKNHNVSVAEKKDEFITKITLNITDKTYAD